MSTQLIYRPKGLQTCTERWTMAANTGKLAQIAWPDYAEHDPAREVALITKIQCHVGALATEDAYDVTTDDFRLVMGFRPRAPINTTTAPPPYPFKWLQKEIMRRAIIAAVTNTVAQVFDAVMDFSADPVIADPYLNNFGLWWDSVAGTVVFNVGGYVDWEIDYKWAAATQESLQAYLVWAQLGE